MPKRRTQSFYCNASPQCAHATHVEIVNRLSRGETNSLLQLFSVNAPSSAIMHRPTLGVSVILVVHEMHIMALFACEPQDRWAALAQRGTGHTPEVHAYEKGSQSRSRCARTHPLPPRSYLSISELALGCTLSECRVSCLNLLLRLLLLENETQPGNNIAQRCSHCVHTVERVLK